MATENRLSLTVRPTNGQAVSLRNFARVVTRLHALLAYIDTDQGAIGAGAIGSAVAWTVVALAVGEDGAVTITVEGR